MPKINQTTEKTSSRGSFYELQKLKSQAREEKTASRKKIEKNKLPFFLGVGLIIFLVLLRTGVYLKSKISKKPEVFEATEERLEEPLPNLNKGISFEEELIAFTDEGRISLLNIESGQVAPLINKVEAADLFYSPLQEKLLFIEQPEANGQQSIGDIWLADLGLLSLEKLTDESFEGLIGYKNPQFSDDGLMIAAEFLNDEKSLTRIFDNSGGILFEIEGESKFLGWFPDNKSILVLKDLGSEKKLAIYNLNREVSREIVDIKEDDFFVTASISREGLGFLYVLKTKEGEGRFEVWKIDNDGLEKEKILGSDNKIDQLFWVDKQFVLVRLKAKEESSSGEIILLDLQSGFKETILKNASIFKFSSQEKIAYFYQYFIQNETQSCGEDVCIKSCTGIGVYDLAERSYSQTIRLDREISQESLVWMTKEASGISSVFEKEIKIASPTHREIVSSPLTVFGEAKVPTEFFTVRIKDEDENILAEEKLPAGSRNYTPFSIELNFDSPQTEKGAVEAFYEDEEGISGLVSIPIQFK